MERSLNHCLSQYASTQQCEPKLGFFVGQEVLAQWVSDERLKRADALRKCQELGLSTSGSVVALNNRINQKWYPAVVQKRHADGHYHLMFSDGHEHKRTPAGKVRPRPR